ncbi:MAG: hypothetical protein IE927_15525, partial [Rhodobacterales bacterium]|nr:hypothetical protein [Rhodobacterales bacterium]
MFRLSAAAAAAFLMSAGLAGAQITPQTLWQDWQAAGIGAGQTLTAQSVTPGPGMLTLQGLTLRSAAAAPGQVELRLDRVTLRDRGDGSVAVELPATAALQLGSTEPGLRLDLALRMPGADLVARGTPGAPDHSLTAPEIGLTLTGAEATGPGAADITLPRDLDVALRGVTARLQTLTQDGGQDGGRRLISDLTAQTLAVQGSGPAAGPAGTPPGPEGSVTLTLDDLASRSDTRLPAGAGQDPAAQLAAGLQSDSQTTWGAAALTVETTGPDGTRTEATAASGSLVTRLAPEGLRQKVEIGAGRIAATGAGLPGGGLALDHAGAAVDLAMPVLPSATPQPFGLMLTLAGLVPAAADWDRLDPQGLLPREPFGLTLDLKGTGNWTADLWSQMPGAVQGGVVPGQLRSLDIARAELRGGGAVVTGQGAFTFDDSLPGG